MEMMMEIAEWLEANRESYTQDLLDFCRIASVREDRKEDMPFGKGPLEALLFAEKLCREYGLTVRDYDHMIASADYDPALPKCLDILAHVDVVPGGEGWTVTEAFIPIVQDGRVYGRGSSDDKGPLLAAIYALRAIKACGIPLKKGVRLVMGADEESGSEDIARYYAEESEAPCTFSPDAEFPLINVEKGRLHGAISIRFTGKNERGTVIMEAGTAVNAVPGKAVIRLEGVLPDEIRSSVALECSGMGVQYDLYAENGSSVLCVIGKTAHAAEPEKGVNAGLAALTLLVRLPAVTAEVREAAERLLKLFPFGDHEGRGLGIAASDPVAGKLTCSPDLFAVTEEGLRVEFDARTPVVSGRENCDAAVERTVRSAGFDYEEIARSEVHAVPADGVFVRTLLEAYQEVTGLPGRAMAIGGGTYVHDLKNGVAFGAVPDGVDTKMHGADEYFAIEDGLMAARIYAAAILKICG